MGAGNSNSILFKCPLIGDQVLPKEEMRQAIRNFLYSQLDEEPGLTSCLIIHTINKVHNLFFRFFSHAGTFPKTYLVVSECSDAEIAPSTFHCRRFRLQVTSIKSKYACCISFPINSLHVPIYFLVNIVIVAVLAIGGAL